MPLCGAKNCTFPELQIFWQKHNCYYCKVGLHGICAIEILDCTPHLDACPACDEKHNTQTPASTSMTTAATAITVLACPLPATQPETRTVHEGATRTTGQKHATTARIVSLKMQSNIAHEPFVVCDMDITMVHSIWNGKATVPSESKKSSFWYPFHIVKVKEYEAYAAQKGLGPIPVGAIPACCNFCGSVLMIHSGTSVLHHHLESKGCTSVLNHQLVVAALVKENQRKSGKCSFIKTTGYMKLNNEKNGRCLLNLIQH